MEEKWVASSEYLNNDTDNVFEIPQPPLLCYVEDNWAYFTTAPLSEQWGDDWNDAPYEHNAGEPIAREPYKIIKVAFDVPMSDLIQPCTGQLNSNYSVEQINKGAVAWLRTPAYYEEQVVITAGRSLDSFIKDIESIGGKVYLDRGMNLNEY